MRRTQVVALTAVLMVTGGAGAGTASADQPARPTTDPAVPVVRLRADPYLPDPRVVDPESRGLWSMPRVNPRGPRAVPMPELLRSGPRPVPMPQVGPEPPLGDRRGLPRSPMDSSRVVPEKLEDTMGTLLP
jgi:hypothetical protein